MTALEFGSVEFAPLAKFCIRGNRMMSIAGRQALYHLSKAKAIAIDIIVRRQDSDFMRLALTLDILT